MAICAGITRGGDRCTQSVSLGQTYCHHHDPSRADERRRAASRAGKSKPSREIVAVKRQLQELADGVLAGSVDRADGAVTSQILNILLRALELERKIREQEVLTERLEVLEEAQKRDAQGKRWGA
jgi:hypothetical protein